MRKFTLELTKSSKNGAVYILQDDATEFFKEVLSSIRINNPNDPEAMEVAYDVLYGELEGAMDDLEEED